VGERGRVSLGANGKKIVEALTQDGPRTRAELAEIIGRDRTTVGNAIDRVNELNPSAGGERAIHTATLEEAQLPPHVVAELPPKPGKKPEIMVLGRPAGRAIGVEIGHGHLSVGVGDANGRLLGSPEYIDEDHEISDVRPEETFERIAEMVRSQLSSSGSDPEEMRAIAISVPVPVGNDGRTLSKHLLPAFEGVNIKAQIRKSLTTTGALPDSIEIWVENDVDVLARGEHRHGKAFGARDFVVLKCSSGIGAAVVADGRLLRGRNGGGAGEIGHTPIRPSLLTRETRIWTGAKEPPCRCSRVGHLEAYAGGQAIVKRSAGSGGADAPTDLGAVIESALADPKGRERLVVEEAGAMLGIAVNSLIHIFNPQMVLVCGKLSEMGEVLSEAIIEECRSQGLIFGDPADVVRLGSGVDETERRRFGMRGAVTTALRKTPARLSYGATKAD
jgi:predicted NBD/HSP70 family sugar kinase